MASGNAESARSDTLQSEERRTAPDSPLVSVILPAYNEASTLRDTVEKTRDALNDLSYVTELVIAEDGCDDATPEIAAALADEHDRVEHAHSAARLGRGAAVEHGFSVASGDILCYFDTDLATDLQHLPELVNKIAVEEFDVAIGSRWMPSREADRPFKRRIPSWGYNFLVRTVLGSTLYDHQCGFKAMTSSVVAEVVPTIDADHWFWDTELLVRAQRGRYAVAEFPVEWEPKGDSKVNLVEDIVGMGSSIFHFWWQTR